MTSRGNQSVSPPAHTQQRHVNAISSSTPPPQQFYAAQSSLSQNAYEFLPTASQAFNQYPQAYGSALGDARGQPSAAGRNLASQQSLVQGGAYYPQSAANVRPQQTQQSHPAYFISQTQSIRHPRPPQSQQMMFIPQGLAPTSNVIINPLPANVYQSARVPVFQPAPAPYIQSTYAAPNIVYYNGNPWRQMAPAVTTAVRPAAPREKKVIPIIDPDTGRDVIEEVIHSTSHSSSTEFHYEEQNSINQNDKEICQTFTRMVADRLKSPDDSNTSLASTDSHLSAGSSSNVSSSQQFHHPPPSSGQQQPTLAANVARPPAAASHSVSGSGNMLPQQAIPTAVVPHDLSQPQVLSVNLSMPPPQIPSRQPGQPIFSNVPPQQQQHTSHHSSHPATQHHQPVRPPPTSTGIPPPPQQLDLIQQSLPVQGQASHYAHNLSASSNLDTSQPIYPVGSHVEPAPSEKLSSSKSLVPSAGALEPPAASVREPAPPKAGQATFVTSGVDAEESFVANKFDKVEPSQGSQGGKDGRNKGKKGRKDFNRKEIGGSDMDAFIDNKQILPETTKSEASTTEGASSIIDTKVTKVDSGESTISDTKFTNIDSVIPAIDAKVTNTDGVFPVINTKVDRTNHPVIDTKITQIDSVIPVSDIEVTKADNTNIVLNAQESNADSSNSVSQSIATNPDTGAAKLVSASRVIDTKNSQQDSTNPVIYTKAAKTDGASRVIDAKVIKPDSASRVIDTKVIKPNIASPVIDAKTTKSENTSVVIDTKVTKPYSASPVIDTKVTKPDSSRPVIDTKDTKPDSARPVIDTKVTKPDSVRPVIDTKATKPDSARPVIDTKVTKPESASRVIATKVTKPVSSSTITADSKFGAMSTTVEAAPAKNVPKRDPRNPWNISAGSTVQPTQKKEATSSSKTPEPPAPVVESYNLGAGENMTRTNNALDSAPEASLDSASSSHVMVKEVQHLPSTELTAKRKEPDNNTSLRQSAGPDVTRDDSPAVLPKPAPAVTQEHSEEIEPESKQSVPEPILSRRTSDQPDLLDRKPPVAVCKNQTPASTVTQLPDSLSATPLSSASAHQETYEEKTFVAPVKDKQATIGHIHNVESTPPVNDDSFSKTKVPPAELLGISGLQATVRHVPEQRPVENGIQDGVDLTPVSSDSADEISKLNYQSDELEPSTESVSKLRPDQGKRPTSHGSSSDSLSRQTADNKSKKEGKEKLQYDRAKLMELRESLVSQTKPDGLPNLEIILDRPIISTGRGSMTAPLDFTPTFFQSTSGQRNSSSLLQHAPPIGKSNSRNRPRVENAMPQRIIKSVSLQDSVKPLHQSEKPWKPTPKQLSAGELAENKRSLESKVLFIMNRLTPTNFERLAEEMKNLNIITYEDLTELVKIFFDKVTLETKFVEAYAQLCKVMSGLKVKPPENSGLKENQATFRVVMLTKCQQEFEADKTIVFEDPEEKRKKIESELPEGPERLAQIENTLYQMKLRRLKFYGNIRFIGELFKLHMLTENIMHDCIYRLLKARDDDSLVSLCNLLTTVGQALDTDKARTRMDQYFVQMGKIADERKSRIKFTLKDAIDLRSGGWVPRKEQTGPKKIDEVHKDYHDEQATKQFLQSQPLPPRNDLPQPGSRRGSRQRQDEKPNDDGWNTVGSKSIRIDASKMKLSKNVVDENSIQLGPGGGMKQFSMWGRGSFGAAQPSQDERSNQPSNRFSALRGEEDPRNYQRSPSRGESMPNRGMRQGPMAGHGRGKMMARSSQEGERRDALASARSIVGGGRSQNSSRDNSWNREERRQTIGPRGSRESDNPMTRSDIVLRPSSDSLLRPPTVSPTPVISLASDDDVAVKKVKPLSEEEMAHKAKTILEEYLNVRDLEEAKLCLSELRGQKYLPVFVTTCINEVLERANKERELTGAFFHEVILQSCLPVETFEKGLLEVLQIAEDIVIDIPKIWTYLAQIIVPILLGGSLPWISLPAILNSCLSKTCAAKLAADIVLLAKDKTSENDVARMWQDAGLSWSQFLPADEVDRFVEDKKLEFTVEQVSRPSTSSTRVPSYGQVDFLKISEGIEKIIRGNGNLGLIYDYVEKAVNVEQQDKHFIRALVTAVINASISARTFKLNEETLKFYKDVLQRYIKSNPDSELQALYAIQSLMHRLEHPSGVIAQIFDALYDEDVITEEAFKLWETSMDPEEVEGKGACSMQLTQFFAWLRENEEPETS